MSFIPTVKIIGCVVGLWCTAKVAPMVWFSYKLIKGKVDRTETFRGHRYSVKFDDEGWAKLNITKQ